MADRPNRYNCRPARRHRWCPFMYGGTAFDACMHVLVVDSRRSRAGGGGRANLGPRRPSQVAGLHDGGGVQTPARSDQAHPHAPAVMNKALVTGACRSSPTDPAPRGLGCSIWAPQGRPSRHATRCVVGANGHGACWHTVFRLSSGGCNRRWAAEICSPVPVAQKNLLA